MRTKRLIIKAAAIGCLLALGVAAAPSASAHGGGHGSNKVRVLAEGLSSPKGLATTADGRPGRRAGRVRPSRARARLPAERAGQGQPPSR